MEGSLLRQIFQNLRALYHSEVYTQGSYKPLYLIVFSFQTWLC